MIVKKGRLHVIIYHNRNEKEPQMHPVNLIFLGFSRQGNTLRFLALILAAATFAAVMLPTVSSAQTPGQPGSPANVILMIGDGMGTTARTLTHLIARKSGKGLVMETFPTVGLVYTFSSDYPATDSAAAATALATGFKTKNRAIGVKADGKSVQTIVEALKKAGYSAGLVTTTYLSHATPGAFAAHASDRDDKAVITRQILDNEVDVLLGGGDKYLVPLPGNAKYPPRPDLYADASSRGYTIVKDRDALSAAVDGGATKVFGAFAPSYMSYDIDRDPKIEPSLTEMTEAALKVLTKIGRPFFLMVEGGRIDHAAHAHDAATVVTETIAFDAAVAAAAKYAAGRGDTLVITVADHETAGPSILESAKIDGFGLVKRSCEWVAEQIRDGKISIDEALEKYIPIPSLKGKVTVEDMKDYKYNSPLAFGDTVSRELGVTFIPIKDQLDSKSTFGHTGSTVPLFAFGPGNAEFSGVYDNTDVARKIMRVLKVDFEGASATQD